MINIKYDIERMTYLLEKFEKGLNLPYTTS